MTKMHGSGPCTSCDYIPFKECENYKNGTFPKCCPNLEVPSTTKASTSTNELYCSNCGFEDDSCGCDHPNLKIKGEK